MLLFYCIIYLITNIQCLTISSSASKSAMKRETHVSDFFPPDLLPVNRKEDVTDIKPIIKNKVKKRLAPPMNFMLRAVEPEGDDYYDKAQADSDSDDYYEKKDWSDLSTVNDAEEKEKNHTQISDIDGVVNIIVGKPKHIAGAPKKGNIELKRIVDPTKPSTEKEKIKTLPSKEKLHKYEDDIDYEESETDKHNKHSPVEYDQNDNESKKTGILDSVDELKERHEKEQKMINEKAKEEEMNREEQERDKMKLNIFVGSHDKYGITHMDKPRKHMMDLYDEYEDKNSLEEKHIATPARSHSTTRSPIRTNKQKGNKEMYEKKAETGKLSVFKNPKFFMIYDEESEESTTPMPSLDMITRSKEIKKPKYSSSYSSTPSHAGDDERISLLPADIDGKEGEPTLFFPKKRKNKKSTKGKTTLAPTDSIVAETVGTKHAKHLTTAVPADSTDSTTGFSMETDTTAAAGPTGTDVVPTGTEPITDAIVASSDQKTEKKNDDYEREKGGEKHFHAEHEEEGSEEAKKAYAGTHEETKSSKGHHEKEDHLGKYDDHGDVDKHHEEESGHYGAHTHEEHGKKHAKYEESGKHSKGHSTKGSHDIHKKEEYEKKVEFFEEEGDSAEDEKTGGYHQEKGHREGGSFKKADFKAGDQEHSKGESGRTGFGGLLHVSKGHKAATGHDSHGKHDASRASKNGGENARKWIYHHGYPAKTANLVRIDRRSEKYFHGPQYFG